MNINIVPQYLCDTIAIMDKNVPYKTRNEEKYIVSKWRQDVFKKSFIPDTICKRNALPDDK